MIIIQNTIPAQSGHLPSSLSASIAKDRTPTSVNRIEMSEYKVCSCWTNRKPEDGKIWLQAPTKIYLRHSAVYRCVDPQVILRIRGWDSLALVVPASHIFHNTPQTLGFSYVSPDFLHHMHQKLPLIVRTEIMPWTGKFSVLL